MKYKYLKDLTSDVAFEAYGKDLKEVFENAAEALSTIICSIDKVKPKNKITREIKGDNPKDLLFNWLQNIIAEVDIEQMFFSKFNITDISEKKLSAELYGEQVSNEKQGTIVKAITNYLFDLKKTEKGYIAIVSMDI